MKLARFLAVSLLLLPGAALAQDGIATFKYTMRSNRGAGPEGQSRVFYSPSAVRIEMQMNFARPAAERGRSLPPGMKTTFNSVMLQKVSEPDKIYEIDDERKEYSVLDLAKIRQSNTRTSDETYTVKRTGSDRVAGIACEKALVTSSKGNEIELCVAPDIITASGWWAAMGRRSGGNSSWVKSMMDAGLKGFPIRMIFRSSRGEAQGGEMAMELTSLEKKSVPGSTFQIPASYRETENAVNQAAETARRSDALSHMTPEQRKAYEDAIKAREKNQ